VKLWNCDIATFCEVVYPGGMVRRGGVPFWLSGVGLGQAVQARGRARGDIYTGGIAEVNTKEKRGGRSGQSSDQSGLG
jgi:hypothetical protein